MAKILSAKVLIPLLVGLAFIALFVRLGFWQLGRAEEKERMLNAFDSGSASTEVVTYNSGLQLPRYSPVRFSGVADFSRILVLDNQTSLGRAGIHVYVPVNIQPDDKWILVNYGWIPYAKNSRDVPDLSFLQHSPDQAFNGLINDWPRPGVKLGSDIALSPNWPKLVPYFEPAEVEKMLERPLLDRVLLMTGEQDGVLRDWQPKVMLPQKHRAYAFQWFSMATAVLVIMLVLLIRMKRS